MPEYLSGDKLYQHLQISKRKMKYLLENGYIPFVDTGKKTHRYLVRLEDAKAFRLRMVNDPESLRELDGLFSSRKGAPVTPTCLLEPTEENSMGVCNLLKQIAGRYLTYKWKKLPDALPVPQAAKLIGCEPSKLVKMIHSNTLVGAQVRSKFYCSKRSFIQYASSVELIGRTTAPGCYTALVEGFKEKLS